MQGQGQRRSQDKALKARVKRARSTNARDYAQAVIRVLTKEAEGHEQVWISAAA